ncbi:MAG: NHLP bacteriocin export ABC transporter permease/ATPase subunit [Treponema sp.]|nr:NHLP bacteriocin export ABC transporter permease/ATPase subunit [Treponema sp.]
MSNTSTDMNSIALCNSTPFDLETGNALVYRVCSGTAYMFAIEHAAGGVASARYEVAVFRKDELIIALPATGNLHYVLTGSLHTEIVPVELSELGTDSASRKNLYAALVAVAIRLKKAYLLEDALQDAAFDAAFFAEDREAAIRQYTQLVSVRLSEERAKDLQAEGERCARRITNVEKAFSAALSDIATVAGGEKTQHASVGMHNESPIVRAAVLVAQADSLEMHPLMGKTYTEKASLNELAKDNNIRLRSVVLKNQWWRHDNGALFGWYIENPDAEQDEKKEPVMEPCALLPEKTGGYVCVRTQNDTSERVTESFASHIHPSANMFYKPMPSKIIQLMDLFRFTFASRKMLSDILLFAVLGILSTLAALLIPELTRMFMDTIIPQAAKNMALQISLLVLFCVFSAAVFDLIKAFVLTRMETRSDFALQAAVIDRLLKLPVGFFKDYTAGNLAQKSLAVSQIRQIVFGVIFSSVMTLVFAFAYLFQLFRYASYLLGWALLISLVPVVLSVGIAIISYKWNCKETELRNRISGTLYQFISGVNKLVMTASEKRAFAVWAKMFSEQNDCTGRLRRYNAVSTTAITCFPLVVSLLLYGLFMHATTIGKIDVMSTGSFLAFMSSYTLFQNALLGTVQAFTQSLVVIPLYEQAKTVLEAVPEIQESKPAVSSLTGSIEISHVSFRYNPDMPFVLNDVSMKIEPGEFVAIVGGSGSGKSTLMRVILGFEKPDSGTVFFDDHDLASLDVGSVRRCMGVVLQNSTVMQGSIYSNITGSSGLTIDDAWKAADMAGLSDDIRSMPMGMHTVVSAGGGTLSGGQRQRLIIARAIARNPSILIFDEATSALDNRTQAQVSKSLESLNVTRIVIAHRLSTIINADRIYVLNHGVIEESGTYDELMKKGGFFAELAKRQQV